MADEGNDYIHIQQSFELLKLRQENQYLKLQLRILTDNSNSKTDAVAHRIQQSYELRNMLPNVKPNSKMKTALLVIDMQKFFGKMVERPLENIRTLNSFFDKSFRPVIFTQHGHTEDELIPPIKNQLVRKVGPDNVLMVGSKGWELIPDIWKMSKDAPIVAKNTYDAFMDTDLDALLKGQGVQRVLVSGVMTDLCCDTTARSAFCRGYETWFISDACWTDNAEQHERALKAVDFLIGRVYTAEEAIEMLNGERKQDL